MMRTQETTEDLLHTVIKIIFFVVLIGVCLLPFISQYVYEIEGSATFAPSVTTMLWLIPTFFAMAFLLYMIGRERMR